MILIEGLGGLFYPVYELAGSCKYRVPFDDVPAKNVSMLCGREYGWALLVSYVEVAVRVSKATEAAETECTEKGCGRIRLDRLFYLRVVLRSRISSQSASVRHADSDLIWQKVVYSCWSKKIAMIALLKKVSQSLSGLLEVLVLGFRGDLIDEHAQAFGLQSVGIAALKASIRAKDTRWDLKAASMNCVFS
jgi:hypothetical protein